MPDFLKFQGNRTALQSRRDQEEGGEGGELDSQEEASPEEIKSREVVLGWRERVGLLLLQLFPNGGACGLCDCSA